MNKKQKIITVSTFIVNSALAIMEFVGLVLMVELYKSYNLHPFGWIKYYTQLSNIFSMIVALMVVVCSLKDLAKNTYSEKKTVRLLKFISTCCLTETFLVTMFVLAPMGMMGGFVPIMFEGPNLYHHFLCPIVSLLSLCILERGSKIRFKHCIYALVPTLISGAITVTLNIMKVMHGPYPFLHVYEQPVYMSLIWAVVVLGGAFAITLLVKLLANINTKKKKES